MSTTPTTRAMGWMTFEDAIAYSRNVVAAKVALGLGQDDRRHRRGSCTTRGRSSASASRPGSTWPARSRGLVNDPAITPWRADRPRQRRVRPGRRGHADPARAGLRGDGQRRRRSSSRTSSRRSATGRPSPTGKGRVIDRRAQPRSCRHDGATSSTRSPSTTTGRSSRASRRRQDRHGPDLGFARSGRWKHNLFNYSFVGFIAREAGQPDLVVAVRIEEGTPTTVRLGQLELPVMSFELFRRVATDAINDARPASRTPAPVRWSSTDARPP